MFKFLGFLIIIGLLAIAFTILFGFSFLRMIFKAIFGTNNPAPRSASSNQQRSKQPNNQSNSSPAKKIITREEGEYIDYEEIKE